MTVRAALSFIAAVRREPALAAALRALGPDPDLADVVALANAHGHACDEAALRRAFVHDWGMRLAVESAPNRAASACATVM
jgi:hypothetical protein